jgi:hypothetical protein
MTEMLTPFGRAVLSLWILDFEFVSDFDIRISDLAR